MTSSVVMLLTGPLQAWGGPVPGIYQRSTETMPTLSGVVGVIANALGRPRSDSIADIADGASLAVRADRPGGLMTDFHTVGTPGRYALATDTGRQLPHPVVTTRHYLADAAFLAVYTPPVSGLSAEEVLHALKHPARPLYLGRRGCVPSERIAVGLTEPETEPMQLLAETMPLLRDAPRAPADPATDPDPDFYAAATTGPTTSVLIETSDTNGSPLSAIRKDAPSSFDPRRSHHNDRRVIVKTVERPVSACAGRGRDAIVALYEALGVSP